MSGKKKAIIHQKKPPKHFTVRCLKQFPRARWGGLTEITGLLGVSVWEEIFREKTFALPPPMIPSCLGCSHPIPPELQAQIKVLGSQRSMKDH